MYKIKKPHAYREILLHPLNGELINLKGDDIPHDVKNPYTGKIEKEVYRGATQEDLAILAEDNPHLIVKVDEPKNINKPK